MATGFRKDREHYVIYCATNKQNGKSYIGQTFNFGERQHDHLVIARSGRKKFPFHAAIKSYGEDQFQWCVLEEFNNLNDTNEAEEFYIAYLGTLYPNGYNMHPGGNNKRPSEYTKIKISENLKTTSFFIGKKGKNHPNFGTKFSEARIRKQSEILAEVRPNQKLTIEQVIEIYNLGLSGVPANEVARRFNCGRVTVGNIYNRKSWKLLLNDLPAIRINKYNSKLNYELVVQILEKANALPGSLLNKSKFLCQQYNVGADTILDVLKGISWTYIKR